MNESQDFLPAQWAMQQLPELPIELSTELPPDPPRGRQLHREQRRRRRGVCMRFVVLLIVLIFPVLDVLATVRFARWTGIPAVAWFVASAIAGVLLLRKERITFRAKTLAALRGDQPLLRGLLDSGRKVLAALLLILPGIVSDLIALLLLLLPINLGAPFAIQPANVGRGFRRD